MKADLDTNPGTLLSRLMVIELDFGTVASQHEVEAASAVWRSTARSVGCGCAVARAPGPRFRGARFGVGYLDLRAHERSSPALSAQGKFPSQNRRWTEVRSALEPIFRSCATRWLTAPDSIDPTFSKNSTHPAGFRVLLGSPGTGKSALARHWTEAGEEPIWLRPTDIRDFWRTGPARLSHALLNTGVPTRVVIDGLDRVFDEEVLERLARRFPAPDGYVGIEQSRFC